MKLLRIVGVTLAVGMFCFAASGAEVWVKPDGTDGTGSGTAADPYVRSTASSFDTLMNSTTIPTYSTIHLMAGTFHTISGFPLRPGWKIRGAGMDSTTVLLDPVTTPIVNNAVIGGNAWYYTFGERHNLEVADLTVDLNLQNQTQPLSYGAVRISGDNARISRIRVVNWGSTDAAECFALVISQHWANNQINTNCVIEGCIIDTAAAVTHTQGTTAISISGGPETPGPYSEVPGVGWIAGAEIRDCLIKNIRTGGGGPGKPLYFNGMGIGNVDGAKVTGNKCIDLENASTFFCSCGSLFNFVAENNLFLNVSHGFAFAGADACMFETPPGSGIWVGTNRFAKENLEFRNNTITLRPGGVGIALSGFCVYPNQSPCETAVFRPMTNITVRGNTIRAVSSAAIGAGVHFAGTRQITLEDNIVASAGGNEIAYQTDTPNGFVTFSSLKNNTAPDGRILNVMDGSNPDSNDREIVFTPSAPGWYRLTQYNWSHSSAHVHITREWDASDNTFTDFEFDFEIRAYTSDPEYLGDIILGRCQDYNGGCVTQLRIANDDPTGNDTFVDIFVATAPASRPIKVKVTGGVKHQFTQNPIFLGNPGPTPTTHKTLAVGRALRTTGNFLAAGTITAGSASTQVTDSSGKVLSGALNIVQTAQGGLGANNSALVADRYPYTIGSGVFGYGVITSVGRDLADSTTQQDARENALGLVISSGDLAGSYPNPTIGNNAVTDAKLRDSAATSVIGRGANSAGDPADIAASADGQYLRRAGGVLSFGAIAGGDIATGLIGTGRLGGGTASSSTFLRGDQNWVVLPNVITKIADESRVNSASLTDDNTLKFTMTASGKYSIRLRVFFSTAATPDFKYRITGPSATLIRRFITRGAGGAVPAMLSIGTTYDSTDVTLLGTGAEGIIDEEIIVHNGGTGGDFKLQWAQNTSNASATIVRAGSYVQYTSF